MSPRRGAALVLALVLLAALLLLGLPFLFSQSSSLAGSRSFADAKQAQIGRDSAESLATAIAAYSMQSALVAGRPAVGLTPADPTAAWSGLAPLYSHAPTSESGPTLDPLKNTVQAVDEGRDLQAENDDGSVLLQPENFGLGFNDPPPPSGNKQRTYLGALVTDTAGKLDPNSMNAFVWDNLLKVLNIPDWDDNKVYGPPGNPAGNPTPPPGLALDGDGFGQLADALSTIRLNLEDHRITRIEQLLLADPQATDASGNPRFPLLRHRLTRAELERLRPFLTVHNPRQGRAGLIDLGTVVFDETLGPFAPRLPLFIDALPERRPLLAVGTVIVGEDIFHDVVHRLAIVNSNVEGNDGSGALCGVTYHCPMPGLPGLKANQDGDDHLAVTGDALAFEAPPPLNIHQLPWVVCQALKDATGNAIPSKPVVTGTHDAAILRTIGDLGLFGLMDRIDPRLAGYEQQPLGVLSGGTFEIDSAATVTDPLGRQSAQSMRRDVVQAVPQEYLLERRWLTQGAMHALLAQRYGSHVQDWPVAVERRLDTANKPVAPDDPDQSIVSPTQPKALTGIRPRPLDDVSNIARTFDSNHPDRPWLQHIRLGWREVLGGDAPAQDAKIFWADDLVNNGQIVSDDDATMAAAVNDLRPDGFHIHSGNVFTMKLTANGGMLVPRVGAGEGPYQVSEMAARHLSLWIKPEADWDASHKLIPILDARMPVGNLLGKQADGTAGVADSENYLGLIYDPQAQMLVLALAPPSIEHTVPLGQPMPADVPGTLGIDERSLGDPGAGNPAPVLAPIPYASAGLAAFTAAAAPNRVLHCFKTPTDPATNVPHFRAGQWYHIQIAIASDRPDGVTLMVDGIVGRDAARMVDGSGAPKPELVQLGDHYTAPTAILADTLSSQGPLIVTTIALAMPAPLTARDVLPERGMVRIDDEYIWYDGIVGNALQHCVRGQRQDTLSSGGGMPTMQAHLPGALVTPGGYRLQFMQRIAAGQPPLPPAKLYRGGCAVGEDFGVGNPAPNPLGYAYTTWAQFDKTKLAPADAGNNRHFDNTATTLDLTNLSAPFPNRGVVRILYPGFDSYVYFGARAGNQLQKLRALSPVDWNLSPLFAPAWTNLTFLDSGAVQPTIVLVSLPTGALPDPTEGLRYLQLQTYVDSAKLLQLMEPNGRVEWLGYDHVAYFKGGTGDPDAAGFFINITGFDYTPMPTPPLLSPSISRGLCRTDFPGKPGSTVAGLPGGGVFPAGSRIIPVQTELGNHGHWLATGDVVTLMPHKLGATSNPLQLVVRYVPVDVFPASNPGNEEIDARNQYAAFTDFIPDTVPDASLWLIPNVGAGAPGCDFLCGTCWSGDDLTPLTDSNGHRAAAPEPRGHLPRLDEWNTGFGLGSDAHVSIGKATSPAYEDGDFTIDGLCAGGLTQAGNALDGHEAPADPNPASTPPTPANAVASGIVRFIKGTTVQLQIGAAVSDIDGVLVQASTPIFPYAPPSPTNADFPEMGLVEIDGEVFAYRRPTADEASKAVSALQAERAKPGNEDIQVYAASDIQAVPPAPYPPIVNGRFARLIARGLLMDPAASSQVNQVHTIPADAAPSDGPFLVSQVVGGVTHFTPHRPLLAAKRLPLGPVLQLGTSLSMTNWFSLTDGVNNAAILYAPTAMFCSADGSKRELMHLVGPHIHVPEPNGGDPLMNEYTTRPWLRGLYNTTGAETWALPSGAGTAPPIVIGWWPRYASALPKDTTVANGFLTEQLRCRAYSWVGLPFSLYGAYVDRSLLRNRLPDPYDSMPLAQIDADLATAGGNATFDVEARALAYADHWRGTLSPTIDSVMDWNAQTAVVLNQGPSDASDVFDVAKDGAHCFWDGSQKARPIDGYELRLAWRYRAAPKATLESIADCSGRAPAINSARLRCLAPVRVIATESAR